MNVSGTPRVKCFSFLALLGVSLWAGGLPVQAQVDVTLTGPAQAANCGTVLLTNQIVNTGGAVSELRVTNELPSSSYAYVPLLSTVTLPDSTVLSGTNAEPAVNNGNTNLVWDFSAVVTPSTVTNLLITEVYYNATQSPEADNEWFEIYNPTTNAVAVTNWSVRDGSPGAIDVLPDFTIAAGEFVIIAASTNAFLAANTTYTGQLFEVADGKIGSGLNNFGDGVILRNAGGSTVDAVSWGASTAAFSPSVPNVAAGRSIARDPANNDTNTRNDWADQAAPDPGAANLPTGIQNGGTITIVYAVEIDCSAVGGQLFSRAGFEQPPGTPGTEEGSVFLTVNQPDLVVTKSPIMQDAGVGDPVTWTVRVENAGFGGAPNVVAVDTLGPGLAFSGFSIAPTTQTVSNAVWDATAISAFTNLAESAYVDIVVTAEVVSCVGLFNRADAAWGCSGLQVLPNDICEDTALINETATAGIRFIDRYPDVTVSLDPNPLLVDYCGGGSLTLFITNAAGPTVGYADNFTFTPNLPAGWTVSGASVDSNGVIQVGRLDAGSSTSLVVTVEAGGTCPIVLTGQGIYFSPDY
ncbi:MAG: lamin tail domain-containing protein, partial [Kiritimatiellia bacterium]|nr:lamin tail domain-containing protein [Kiritimatiellia bacterium]